MSKEILKKVVDTVNANAFYFDIDIKPSHKFHSILQRLGAAPKKRTFVISPLTLSQLYRVSKCLLEIDLNELDSDSVLKMMVEHADVAAEIVAIAVTASRQEPSTALKKFLFDNLSQKELRLVMSAIAEQMNVLDFITTIVSIRKLSILDQPRKTSPLVPGEPSEV